jgi:hypothetical protein
MTSDRILRAATALLLLATMPIANAAVSVLTIDGEVHTLADDVDTARQRVALGENGRRMVLDEFAVLQARNRATVLSFVTEGFEPSRAKLAGLDLNGLRSRARLTSEARAAAPLDALLIKHQAGHALNHNFTPTPTSEFVSQPVSAEALEGQRGFAVVDIGESGRVLGLKLFVQGDVVLDRNLETAIIDGIKTTFRDERRHDHTVYMAYEIRGQTVNQVGSPVVTLPMCGPICP